MKLLALLLGNPYLLILAFVWIVGLIGSRAKAARARKEREAMLRRQAERRDAAAEREQHQQRQPHEQKVQARAQVPNAEQIQREIRRILDREGSEERATGDARPSVPEPTIERRPTVVLPSARPRNDTPPERPPLPVLPTTGARRLPTHVDPHVGERLAQRQMLPKAGPSDALGDLGGRRRSALHGRTDEQRYALTDLKRAFVLSEILGEPLATRPRNERGI